MGALRQSKVFYSDMSPSPGQQPGSPSGYPAGIYVPSVSQGLPTLIVMIVVLFIILLFCFWGAPAVRSFCKRRVCCCCPMDEPNLDNVREEELRDYVLVSTHKQGSLKAKGRWGTEDATGRVGPHAAGHTAASPVPHRPANIDDAGSAADGASTPTIILLPYGRMLVVDRSVFAQLQADHTGIDFMEVSANLIRAQRLHPGSSPSIFDSEATSKGLSPVDLLPPAYDEICDLPPSYSEVSIMLRSLTEQTVLEVEGRAHRYSLRQRDDVGDEAATGFLDESVV